MKHLKNLCHITSKNAPIKLRNHIRSFVRDLTVIDQLDIPILTEIKGMIFLQIYAYEIQETS